MNVVKAIKSEIFKVSIDLRACETSLETLRVYLESLLDEDPLADPVSPKPEANVAAIQRYATPPAACSRCAF
ncbi:hypothetical protein [Beijerinckia sp. L45]|uniref:hypothetical protein n=1 Tax=Beijerinckia sp. L45 TaxID=1641855 RepID=UPI00131D5C59|nr:hypothetical protein [Beijerinckia sp. L45]